jgi:hypothetical protein
MMKAFLLKFFHEKAIHKSLKNPYLKIFSNRRGKGQRKLLHPNKKITPTTESSNMLDDILMSQFNNTFSDWMKSPTK